MNTFAKKIDLLHENLTHEMDHSNSEIDSFAYKLIDNNAAHEFEWGSGALLHAARVEINQRLIQEIDEMAANRMPSVDAWNLIVAIATKELRSRASNPMNSDAPMSNLMNLARLSAWSDLAQRIGVGS